MLLKHISSSNRNRVTLDKAKAALQVLYNIAKVLHNNHDMYMTCTMYVQYIHCVYKRIYISMSSGSLSIISLYEDHPRHNLEYHSWGGVPDGLVRVTYIKCRCSPIRTYNTMSYVHTIQCHTYICTLVIILCVFSILFSTVHCRDLQHVASCSGIATF